MAVSNFRREYGGVVWTNHAFDRLGKRSINQGDALAVMRHPEKTFPGKKNGSVKFIRTINGRKIHVVATPNENDKWVVMSVWVRGEEDRVGLPEKIVGRFVDWVMGKIMKSLGK